VTTPNGTFAVRDEATIRDAMLRTVANGFLRYGLSVPNTRPGSELYLRFQAIARQLTVTESNGVVSVNNQMPDTAVGIYLTRWLSLLGLSVRPAGGSAGNVNVTCSATTTIPVNTPLVDGAGLRYRTTVGGLYANNTPCPVVAVDGGVATNHENGDSLRWVVPPPFCPEGVTVGLPGGGDGLVGGIDAEDPESARSRMVLRLQNAMFGGNWTTFALLGANASPLVQQAFVYPAANGPGTCHVACAAYASSIAASNARNRDLAAAVMNGVVIPYVTGNVAEYAEVVVTTIANQPVDVGLGLSIPYSPASSPPGPGGGWLDATPWPTSTGGAPNVVSVASSTSLVVDAPVAPVVGVSRVAWLDPFTWQLRTATVVASSGSPGNYAIKLDTPWVNLLAAFGATSGATVFPQSANQATYIASILGAFGAMGPGEKTNAAGLVSRALRKPLPASLYPYSLGGQQLRAVTDSDPLVAGTSYLYRSATTPTLPGSVALPPNLLVPRNIGFFPA
jgi:uncharacterized phage protein gp47/JayE